MMMKEKNYFLLELHTCLQLTSQKLLDDMVGLHVGDQKICPQIGNKAMNESTMIILHLPQCFEKLYSNISIEWIETYFCAL
jgi:hypothetical protein